MDADLRSQILCAVDEVEYLAADFPRDSVGRLMFVGFVETVRQQLNLNDVEKTEIVLRRLRGIAPCTQERLEDCLDFSRDESRRLIRAAVEQGYIERFKELGTGGRARILLQLP